MPGARALAPWVAIACLLAAGPATAAAAAGRTLTATPITTSLVTSTSTSAAPTAISSARATAIAARLPLVRSLKRTHPRSFSQVSSPVAGQWQVAFYSRNQEFVQVLVSSTDGHVIAQYTGFKIAWTMARGIPGAFGEHVNALYVWLPLCLLFLGPFLDWRRPLRVRNLDLLVLTSLSISLALFNHADIYQSVPLSYPPLIYLLARLVYITLRRRAPAPAPLVPNVPVGWLAVGLVVLIGARIGLNVADSNVIDVGYANVVGAQKVINGKALYGHFPSDIAQGDTYGPVAYEAYTPFVALWGFSGTWDDLPAAHAAAIFFDLVAIALLLALGWRIRGPATGVVLAYAWAAFPFTAFALESNSNDALVASLVLATLLVAASPPARGAFAALAALAKFAPLALIPLFATHRLRDRGARGIAGFVVALVIVAAAVSVPALTHDSLHTIYERTIAYQADRSAPFSVWGLYGGLRTEQTLVQVLAILLAAGLAVLPHRDDAIGLAAATGAILIAVQLGVTYWFYLYVPWFAGPALIAILADAPLERRRRRGAGGGYVALSPTRTPGG